MTDIDEVLNPMEFKLAQMAAAEAAATETKRAADSISNAVKSSILTVDNEKKQNVDNAAKKKYNGNNISRSSDTRDNEAREFDERAYAEWDDGFAPDFSDLEQGSLYLDLSKMAPGFRYRWIRARTVRSIKGDEDYRNLSTAARQGWRPVPADEGQRASAKKSLSSEFYIQDELILMRRPTKYDDQYKEMVSNRNKEVFSTITDDVEKTGGSVKQRIKRG